MENRSSIGRSSSGTPDGILPLGAHLDMTAATGLDHCRLDPRARVDDHAAFEEMRSHIVDFYSGIDEVVHAFETAGGAVFDCVPYEQQPALRDWTGPYPVAPDLTEIFRDGPAAESRPAVEPPRIGVDRDRHGNLRQAPEGSVPVRRVTLTDLGRFATLADSHRKFIVPADAATHLYARAWQNVNNLGGHSRLSLDQPVFASVDDFALSQQWFAAGDGDTRQTIEVGWQVYPAKYGDALPHGFIFWTPDNYATGAYNNEDSKFIKASAAPTFVAAPLTPVSIVGGAQYEIEIAVYLSGGNWWLYVGGITAANAIGCYPASLFGTGPMASGATRARFGGETASDVAPRPPMGSGEFAATGWPKAGFHRTVYYHTTGGGSQWLPLTPDQANPAQYTVVTNTASDWGAYFFYGGPGGAD